jgi:hypothetical protein
MKERLMLYAVGAFWKVAFVCCWGSSLLLMAKIVNMGATRGHTVIGCIMALVSEFVCALALLRIIKFDDNKPRECLATGVIFLFASFALYHLAIS